MKTDQLPPSLRYVNDEMPGYSRHKKGKGFIYKDEHGKAMTSEKLISRFERLVIPPMWKDVWISKSPNGHIQATGKDEKGRKQYIYHHLWKEHVAETKYNELLHFGECLPAIRKQVEKDLRKRTWSKPKVLALAVKLMDEYHLRVGNKFYEEENDTYGVTTLRRKHVKENGKGLLLQYTAKSGKLQEVSVENPSLKKLIKQCSELPGYELFRYQSESGYQTVDSKDINDYLREISGEEFTAKYFRTWGGTVAAVQFAAQAQKICEENPRKKPETTLLQLIASHLNNTVAVCREHYVHPELLKAVLETNLLSKLKKQTRKKWYSKEEHLVIDFLKEIENGRHRKPIRRIA